MKLEKINKDEAKELIFSRNIEGYIAEADGMYLMGKTPDGLSIWTPDTPYLFDSKDRVLDALKEESDIKDIHVYRIKATKAYSVEEGV